MSPGGSDVTAAPHFFVSRWHSAGMNHRGFLLLALAITACDPGRLDNPDRFKACTLNVETQVFVPKCGSVGCHSATSPQGGLDLVTAGVGMRLKNGTSTCAGKKLVPFTAEKLGTNPQCGSPMPLGEPLTADEDKCVREYLAALADGGT